MHQRMHDIKTPLRYRRDTGNVTGNGTDKGKGKGEENGKVSGAGL